MQEVALGNDLRVCRSLVAMTAGALLTIACGGGGMAPVVERSSTAAGSSQSANIASPSAGSEAADSDWTAKVRPLGDAGSTASRELPSETPLAAPAPVGGVKAAPAPDASQSGRSAAPVPSAGSSAAVNPAVVSLLNTASVQSRAGEHAQAAATLERAIAIEPKNAWLWHRLADTRIKEGRLEQAAALAAKSNALASDDRSLQADNWKLIAEVRRRQGDSGGAAAAESEAAKLSN